MKFGYFFQELAQQDNRACIKVQIRPLDNLQAVDLGFRIDIRTPLIDASAPLDESVKAALEAAQKLLPEQALSEWVSSLPGKMFARPSIPPDGMAQWNKLIYSDMDFPSQQHEPAGAA